MWRRDAAPRPSRDDGLHELPPPRRALKSLARGVLIFRWIWLLWMILVAVSGDEPYRLPELAWASLGLAVGWTLWMSVVRETWDVRTIYGDLIVCGWLVIASALVVPEGDVISGRPFFATGFPLSAAMLWGAAKGPYGGITAGVVLGSAHVLSRPLNGVALTALDSAQVQNLAGAFLNYVVAGVAVGLVSRVFTRSAVAVEDASKKLMHERERAARFAEREKLARHVHDSVLQALTLVHKKGRELAQQQQIEGTEVAQLAALAAQQEEELRSLILREPEEGPSGQSSLREALEKVAREFHDPPTTVSAVGPISIDSNVADEVSAAVRQALENVARHAQAQHVAIFAEEENGSLLVSVRDDGKGFTYDEAALRSAGKAGMLRSMKGRAEELGGEMKVASAPGKGTEIEFRIPMDRP